MPRTAPTHRRAALGALTALAVLAAGAAPGLAATFEDAQAAAGVAWVHANSKFPNYPETNGSGLCWGDVDGDGADDLFLVNGRFSDQALQASFDPRSALYINEGDGTFTDASRAWGADLSAWGQGCSLADYDGDGDLDLLVVGYDYIALLRNDGRRFAEVTAQAQLTLEGKCGVEVRCFGETGSWADYDGDGDLDLYVTNYVDWDIDVGGPVTPSLYNGQPNVLFRNRGDGTFEDATAEAGVGDDPGPNHSKSFQSSWADYDGDGDPDLYVASDTVPNSLFRNHGDGTFTDVAAEAGVDNPNSSMGLVFYDITGDGRPDVFLTHYAGEHNGLHENLGDGTFRDRSGEGGLADDLLQVAWGTAAADFDHDGDMDLFAANGHTEVNFTNHKQLPQMFRQGSDGRFSNVSGSSGGSFNASSVARGAALADYDLDGDLDIAVLAHYNETMRLFQHQGTPGHWLQVELRQAGMNRFAVGAEVTITPAGGKAATRVVQAGDSFLSQSSMAQHFGLGGAAQAEVRVRWPWGEEQTWTGVDADQRVRLTRGSADVVRDTLSPRTNVAMEGTGQHGWFRTPVTVTLVAQDRAMGVASGVVLTELRLGDGEDWQPYASPVAYDEEGIHVVSGRSTDHVGNREPAQRREVRIDLQPPVTAARVEGPEGEDGWYRRAATVLLDARDALSGVGRVWHRVDGGAWAVGDSVGFAGSGTRVVEYYAEDRAGNREAPRTVVVKVDAEPPTVDLQPWPLAAGTGSVALEAIALDDASGVRRVKFFVDDEAAPRHVDRDGSDGWRWALPAPMAARVTAVAEDAVGYAAGAATWVVAAPEAPAAPPLGLLVLGALPLVARRRA